MARTPVQWTGSPEAVCSSKTATSQPRWASLYAANSPPGPPPMMATSRMRIVYESVRLVRGKGTTTSDLWTTTFPCAAERDPEGQRDQPHVERKGLPLDVQTVVPKLVPPRNVARRVDLRDAGEARAHRVAFR